MFVLVGYLRGLLLGAKLIKYGILGKGENYPECHDFSHIYNDSISDLSLF